MTTEIIRDGLVAPSDIAELAGVSRAAVSNWRKRSQGFPESAGGTEAKPLFDRAEVSAWLRGRGYEPARTTADIDVFGLFNTLDGSTRIERMAAVLLSLLCARKLSAETADGNRGWDRLRAAAAVDDFEEFDTVVGEFEDTDERWSQLVPRSEVRDEFENWAHPGRRSVGVFGRLVDIIDRIDPGDLASVGDRFLARVVSAQVRSGGDSGFVGSRTSALLVRAASGAQGVLYDPACGIGEALIGLSSRRAGDVRVVGQEIDPTAARFARQRCYLHGVPIDIGSVDVLGADPVPGLLADVIVVEPPFGLSWRYDRADPRWAYGIAPSKASEFAWIQHAVAHLASEGRAYVITPLGPAFKSGPAAAIRSGLLRDGCIEAIVGLPGKMLPHTSIPLALWVLRRPGASVRPGKVLFVDGSASPDPEDRIDDWLAGRKHDALDQPPHAEASIVDIVASDADLDPRKWVRPVGVEPEQIARKLSASQSALRDALNDIAGGASSPAIPDVVSTAVVLTVLDLVRQGIATIEPGRARPGGGRTDSAPRVVTVGDLRVPMLEVPEIRSTREGSDLSRPGDVLVATAHTIRTVVDHRGGNLCATGVYRLRVDPDRLDPEYVAHCLAGDWNTRFLRGTGAPRADIKDLEIPVVPLAEQEAIVAALDQARGLETRAQHVADAANSVAAALLSAVRFTAPLHASV